VGFGISGVEPSGSATSKLTNFVIIFSGMRLSPLGTAATMLSIVSTSPR
jgi:hypothetical protein